MARRNAREDLSATEPERAATDMTTTLPLRER